MKVMGKYIATGLCLLSVLRESDKHNAEGRYISVYRGSSFIGLSASLAGSHREYLHATLGCLPAY